MIALSTAWISEDGWTIEQVFDALEILGAESVELNYRVHPLNLESAKREIAKRGLTVASLHNICSEGQTPTNPTDRYGDAIASLDETARQVAITHLKETAETARALGARAVVVHGGAVESLKESETYHKAMKQASRANNPEILKPHLPALMKERQRLAPQHMERLIGSLNEVCPLFPDIEFGLEIRYHYHSLPDFDELETALSQVETHNIGYWHDCGHGQVQENIGIRRHEDWLSRYQDRLIGIHLHGMKNLLLDHQAPTPDNMDFAMIHRYTKPGTLLTIEASGSNSVAAMQAGKAYLESIFTT